MVRNAVRRVVLLLPLPLRGVHRGGGGGCDGGVCVFIPTYVKRVVVSLSPDTLAAFQYPLSELLFFISSCVRCACSRASMPPSPNTVPRRADDDGVCVPMILKNFQKHNN